MCVDRMRGRKVCVEKVGQRGGDRGQRGNVPHSKRVCYRCARASHLPLISAKVVSLLLDLQQQGDRPVRFVEIWVEKKGKRLFVIGLSEGLASR